MPLFYDLFCYALYPCTIFPTHPCLYAYSSMSLSLHPCTCVFLAVRLSLCPLSCALTPVPLTCSLTVASVALRMYHSPLVPLLRQPCLLTLTCSFPWACAPLSFPLCPFPFFPCSYTLTSKLLPMCPCLCAFVSVPLPNCSCTSALTPVLSPMCPCPCTPRTFVPVPLPVHHFSSAPFSLRLYPCLCVLNACACALSSSSCFLPLRLFPYAFTAMHLNMTFPRGPAIRLSLYPYPYALAAMPLPMYHSHCALSPAH